MTMILKTQQRLDEIRIRIKEKKLIASLAFITG
jgi:hypothetical protein